MNRKKLHLAVITVTCAALVLLLPEAPRAAEPAAKAPAPDRTPVTDRVKHATAVLNAVTHIPEAGIPDGLLRSCHAVVIIPHLQSGAFMVGGRYGRGLLVNRVSPNQWSNPCFVGLAGGSYGLQAGYENLDLVLLIMNRHGLEALLKHKITLGGDATFAAGPIGRNFEGGIDWRLKAEFLSYSRCRGLFAGVALQGARLGVDKNANTLFYGNAVDPAVLVEDTTSPHPEEVKPLIQILAKFGVTEKMSPQTYKELQEKANWPPPKKAPQPKLKI